jgi:hypothetical protein
MRCLTAEPTQNDGKIEYLADFLYNKNYILQTYDIVCRFVEQISPNYLLFEYAVQYCM